MIGMGNVTRAERGVIVSIGGSCRITETSAREYATAVHIASAEGRDKSLLSKSQQPA
jgi:hypothetical protein